MTSAGSCLIAARGFRLKRLQRLPRDTSYEQPWTSDAGHCRFPCRRGAAGRRSEDLRRLASPKISVFQTDGTSRREKTSCGAGRFQASAIRALSSGAIDVRHDRDQQQSEGDVSPGLYGDGDASDDRSRHRLDDLRDRQTQREDPMAAVGL